MVKVAVVVVNWNRKELTLSCLADLKKLSSRGLEIELVVVDNGSTDGSVGAIRKSQIPNPKSQIKLIENGENLGYAEGNNTGVRAALGRGADYVLVMNNDIVPREDLVVKLVKVAEKGGEVGLVSPKIYFAKGYEFHKKRYKRADLGKVIWYAGGRIDWKNVAGVHIGVDEVDRGQFDKLKRVDFASGSCVLVRREVWEEVGLFDGRYFMYFEDVDLAVRAKKRGWEAVYAPVTCVWHKVSSSSAIGSNLNDYFISRNRMIFGMRYAPWRAKTALIRESGRLLVRGRQWQRKGITDFYLRRWGKGRWR